MGLGALYWYQSLSFCLGTCHLCYFNTTSSEKTHHCHSHIPFTSSIKLMLSFTHCSWQVYSLWHFIVAMSPFNTNAWLFPDSSVLIFHLPSASVHVWLPVGVQQIFVTCTGGWTEGVRGNKPSKLWITKHTPLLWWRVLAVCVGNSQFCSRK